MKSISAFINESRDINEAAFERMGTMKASKYITPVINALNKAEAGLADEYADLLNKTISVMNDKYPERNFRLAYMTEASIQPYLGGQQTKSRVSFRGKFSAYIAYEGEPIQYGDPELGLLVKGRDTGFINPAVTKPYGGNTPLTKDLSKDQLFIVVNMEFELE